MQGLGDLRADEPGGALYCRMVDGASGPPLHLLVALAAGAGTEHVAEAGTQKNPEHLNPTFSIFDTSMPCAL